MVQLLVIIAALLFFVQVIFLTTKNKLTDQQAFIWILFSLGGVILAFALPWLNTISTEMGIAYPPALIMLVAFLIVLTFSVYHTTLISKQEEKVKLLIQEVAFLQKELRDAKEGKQPE